LITRRHLLALSAALSPWPLRAQQNSVTAWPDKTVKLVVGFPAGQGSDILARVYSEQLRKPLGQTVFIDNKPGAGATIAADIVAHAPPDGYTLLLTSSGPMSIAPHLYRNLGYDAMKDLDPIALVGSSPLMLLVRSDSPAKTLPELVSLSHQRAINCGSGGNGITNHLALEMFKIVSGADFLHVPYKGAAPALNDLLAGQIQTMFETTSAALSYVQSGKLRALAVTSPHRYPELPNIPTVAEFYQGFEAVTWAMFAAPNGTPAVITERLSSLLNKFMLDETVKKKLLSLGIDTTPDTSPAAAKSYAMSEYKKWGDIIARATIRLE
jgi:tripartite-type tricarboxylate transporter receptor subunit TctC